MSRKIFKASETKQISSKVLITPPHIIKKQEPETIEGITEAEQVTAEKEIQPVFEKEKLSVEGVFWISAPKEAIP